MAVTGVCDDLVSVSAREIVHEILGLTNLEQVLW